MEAGNRVATTTTRLTIDDFEQLPAEMAEGHELADGELIACLEILRITIQFAIC
jgi:hypothetical protein